MSKRINTKTGVIEETDSFCGISYWRDSENSNGNSQRVNTKSGVFEEKDSFLGIQYWKPSEGASETSEYNDDSSDDDYSYSSSSDSSTSYTSSTVSSPKNSLSPRPWSWPDAILIVVFDLLVIFSLTSNPVTSPVAVTKEIEKQQVSTEVTPIPKVIVPVIEKTVVESSLSPSEFVEEEVEVAVIGQIIVPPNTPPGMWQASLVIDNKFFTGVVFPEGTKKLWVSCKNVKSKNLIWYNGEKGETIQNCGEGLVEIDIKDSDTEVDFLSETIPIMLITLMFETY